MWRADADVAKKAIKIKTQDVRSTSAVNEMQRREVCGRGWGEEDEEAMRKRVCKSTNYRERAGTGRGARTAGTYTKKQVHTDTTNIAQSRPVQAVLGGCGRLTKLASYEPRKWGSPVTRLSPPSHARQRRQAKQRQARGERPTRMIRKQTLCWVTSTCASGDGGMPNDVPHTKTW